MSYPEAFAIGQNYRLSKLNEFSYDDEVPPFGALVMFEPPLRGVNYTVGVDPSWGVGQDRSAIHVMKNGTVHGKDTQVAEFCVDDMNVHELTPICYMIGSLYKNEVEDTEALMAVECNISDDIVHRLRNDYQYGNLFIWKYYDSIKRQLSNKLGWWTNARTRPKIIVKGTHYIKKGWWDVRSPWTLNEFATIEKLDDKAKVQAAKGHHDDLAFAALIALWSAHDLEFNEFGQLDEVAQQRDRKGSVRAETMYDHRPPPLTERKDFINTACSVDDMMNYGFPES